MNLSRLTKLDLRKIWSHEAHDFSRWLAQSENLSLLSEEIGTEIKLLQLEANVGKFSVDILAEEEGSGRKIIIENQLEETNHDHLGKIITYASGYDAEIIIWIVKDVRQEHQKAIEWLNDHTDESIDFFLIKIELWQIDESTPAPKFEIISSPNEWAKTIKTNAISSELTNTKLQQLDFWTKFKEFAITKDRLIRLQTPRPQHWYDVSMGTSDAHIALTVNTREQTIGAELYIPRNKQLYSYLEEHKSEINTSLGADASWVNAETASMIRIRKQVNPQFLEEGSVVNFEWLYSQIIRIQNTVKPYLKRFKE